MAIKPYQTVERAVKDGLTDVVLVYEHPVAGGDGKFPRKDVLVVEEVRPDQVDAVRRSVSHTERVGNEGFENGYNIGKFDQAIDEHAAVAAFAGGMPTQVM